VIDHGWGVYRLRPPIEITSGRAIKSNPPVDGLGGDTGAPPARIYTGKYGSGVYDPWTAEKFFLNTICIRKII
jgi:hypothetical protein